MIDLYISTSVTTTTQEIVTLLANAGVENCQVTETSSTFKCEETINVSQRKIYGMCVRLA